MANRDDERGRLPTLVRRAAPAVVEVALHAWEDASHKAAATTAAAAYGCERSNDANESGNEILQPLTCSSVLFIGAGLTGARSATAVSNMLRLPSSADSAQKDVSSSRTVRRADRHQAGPSDVWQCMQRRSREAATIPQRQGPSTAAACDPSPDSSDTAAGESRFSDMLLSICAPSQASSESRACTRLAACGAHICTSCR